MNRFIAVITMLVLACNAAVFAASPGTSVFSFLKINPSARSVGMGELTGIISPQITVANPGILPWIERPEITMQHVKFIQDVNYSMLGYVYPFGDESAMNVSLGILGVSGLTRTVYSAGSSDGYVEEGSFEYGDRLLSFGYGRKLSRDVSLGASVKYAQEIIDNTSSGAAMLSVGGLYFPWATDWQIGFGFNNLGTQVKNFDLPASIYAGAGKQLYPYMFWGIENVFYTDTIMEVRTGFEFNVSNMMFFRLGYKHILEDQKLGDLPMVDITGGIGCLFQDFSFDYAWAPYGDLAQAHRVTLGYKFN